MNLYERQHIRDIAKYNQQISAAIEQALKDLAKRYQTVKGKRFSRVIADRMKDLQAQIKTDIETGVKNQWLLANEKTNKVIDGYLAAVKVSDSLQKSFRSPNLSALNAFIDRRTAGLNLSDRVWKTVDGIQSSMEDLIAQGILEGKSAVVLSKELKKYISGKPIEYKGELVKGSNLEYQSLRLAATEINIAFRTSDYLQNSRLPFVTGVNVILSNSHPREDICDSMQGHYPKGFEFTGWHVNCICIAEYETLGIDDFAKYIDTGEINKSEFTTNIPDRARKYLQKNGDKLLGYKNPPYWMDNFTKELKLKKSVVNLI